jgi:signal peptidase
MSAARRTRREERARSSRTRRAARFAFSALPILLCASVCALLWPVSLGGSTSYVNVSGRSMLPTYKNGDLVVTRKRATYKIGDTIAYQVPAHDVGAGMLVIHRIIGGSAATGFVTRGDNRRQDDLWRPKPTDVIGKAWIGLPSMGDRMGSLRTPAVLAGFATLMSLAFAFEMFKKPNKPKEAPDGFRA